MKRTALVIVTFKRQELLSNLLNSITQLTQAPWRIIVVDNENSSETASLVSEFSETVKTTWGETTDDPDAHGGTNCVCYVPMEQNTGGSGGFSEGVRVGYELGAEWFWVMDDDVAVLPDGLDKLDAWSDKAEVIQGQRYDFDGGPFFWQYRFSTALGIYNPLAKAGFDGVPYRECNVMCFEGACFKRSVVQKIGLPDARFFIYWDDALYGYLASKVTQPILIPDFVLSRCREVPGQSIGSVRQLNSTSDMTRYYITRNRGYIARYFQVHGDYNPVLFGVGTALTFAKEIIRLILVDRAHFSSGLSRLIKGWKDARLIYKDATWRPQPPLD